MSNVLLENASSGRFLITTDNPGCQETVLDGKTGYIYPGGEIDKMIEKIELFLGMENVKRMNMGMDGRKYIEMTFSRNKVIDAYVKRIKEYI